jgi:hypothetical protein
VQFDVHSAAVGDLLFPLGVHAGDRDAGGAKQLGKVSTVSTAKLCLRLAPKARDPREPRRGIISMALPLAKLPDEIKTYLAMIIEEDLDKNRDHLVWLDTEDGQQEDNRARQIAETERAIELAKKAQEFFLLPPDPERPEAADEATAQ